jgi:hypothetical protein
MQARFGVGPSTRMLSAPGPAQPQTFLTRACREDVFDPVEQLREWKDRKVWDKYAGVELRQVKKRIEQFIHRTERGIDMIENLLLVTAVRTFIAKQNTM